MLADLDATLEALLGDAAAPADLRSADVSFATPDRDYKPGQPTVDLFLHEVTENRVLRDDARVASLSRTTWTSRMPSMRVDCTYLVTTWSSAAAGLRTREEHRLLGSALAWLGRFQVIEDRFLQGTLRTPPQPYPVPAAVARPGESPTAGHFWSALGIPPRPALTLTVTIAVEPHDAVETTEAFQGLDLRTTSVTSPALQGRVRDHALAPVAGASVAVTGTGLAATTDAAGGFVLRGLDPGTHTLRVQAAGHPVQERAIAYAADAQVHDLVLAKP